MKKVNFLFLACLMLLFIGTSAKMPSGTSNPEVITIKNTTTFDIDQIYLSPADEEDWGDDIMDEDEILEPGEEIEVEIDCDVWDVKLVAGDGSSCEITGVNICASSQWNIVADCN